MNKEIFEGEVESLNIGGQGVLRKDRWVYFVPFTAPQDIIQAEVVERKKNYGIAKINKLLQPSPARVQPLCPYFGSCGGCQLQHMDYDVQCQQKKKMVQDALERLGGLSISPISFTPSLKPWLYRQHITLHIRDKKVGYVGVDYHTLLPIDFCPIFSNGPWIKAVQEIVRDLNVQKEGRVTILKTEENAILYFQLAEPTNEEEVFSKSLYGFEGIRVKKSYGKTLSQIEVEGLKFLISPSVFLQNNREISLKINQKILEIAQEKKAILDLYCGIGITSLLLARGGAKVIGVEGNKEAIQLAIANAKANNLEATFLQGDVKKVLPKLAFKADLTIVNPPRTGLERQVCNFLATKGSQDILYISCMPPTLARDLKILCERNYTICHCHAYDMFPQTAHVETLVHLTRVSHKNL